uniref:Rab-GAP TBC domain-containing protein n=1 Tax=Rhabditophanes sp. KR3021 TaxID=114890 RepID=A0AC35TN11_9BILA
MSSVKYNNRIVDIESVLFVKNDTVPMDELRECCTFGIPEKLRPLSWRLLLHFLPSKRSDWKSKSEKDRMEYDKMVENIFTQPGQFSGEQSNDHPLALDPDSGWDLYFKDNQILLQIDKDVRRLRPEFDFFQRLTKFPHKIAAAMNLAQRISQNYLTAETIQTSKIVSRVEDDIDYANSSIVQLNGSLINDGPEELHWQVVERILFVYSKMHLGVKYVQGMHEILCIIYYVLSSDPDLEWSEHAEADSFYCFQNLMSEIQDNFIKTLDSSHVGIEARMESFHSLLQECDPELHDILIEKRSIRPQFYAFRWLSLLLSQEFSLPDVIMLWDCLLADKKRFDLLDYVCIAMIENQREALIEGEFGDNIRLLQNYPSVDINNLVAIAHDIKNGTYFKKPQQTLKLLTSEKTAHAKNAINNAMKNILTKFKR